MPSNLDAGHTFFFYCSEDTRPINSDRVFLFLSCTFQVFANCRAHSRLVLILLPLDARAQIIMIKAGFLAGCAAIFNYKTEHDWKKVNG